MIDDLNINHKVGLVWIHLNDNNPITKELLIKMIDRYYNVYDITIADSRNRNDDDIHNLIE